MGKAGAALDDDDFAIDAAGRPVTRGRLKDFIARRYSTRVHMSLILSACGLTGMISSWTMLHMGVHSMLVRYPVAIVLAYGTFLLGVWIWLRATNLGGMRDGPSASRKLKDGGGLDGGGANAAWAEGQPTAAVVAGPPSQSASASSRGGSRSSSSFGLDIDGDGLVLLLLAALLVLVIFLCSGYLIWTAPDVLTEAAFGAALTGTLSRPSAAHAADGWIAGVLRKTWWPFALVMVASLAFAGWSVTHYPQAATFKQAIAAAIHGN